MEDLGLWERSALYAALGILPWIFALSGGWLIWSAYRLQSKARLVKGTVAEMQEQLSAPRSNDYMRVVTSYRPVFSYTGPDGEPRQVETFLNSMGYNLEPGTEREILILDEDPGMARLPGMLLYAFGAVFLAGGTVFGIICLLVLSAL